MKQICLFGILNDEGNFHLTQEQENFSKNMTSSTVKIEKEIIVIGDRILINPDTDKQKTQSGLYLPQGISQKEQVQTGIVLKTGPGYIVPYNDSSEPWLEKELKPKYIPLQVRPGDYALFLRRDAVEIEYENKKYIIVPQSAVLAVVRDKIEPADDE